MLTGGSHLLAGIFPLISISQSTGARVSTGSALALALTAGAGTSMVSASRPGRLQAGFGGVVQLAGDLVRPGRAALRGSCPRSGLNRVAK